MTLTPPTKTSYALGEELNLDGMVAKLNYSDKSVGTTAYDVFVGGVRVIDEILSSYIFKLSSCILPTPP